MAANLTGMFAQMNQAIGRNPLATGAGQGLLDQVSQGGGNLLHAAGLSASPYDSMNEGAKLLQGTRDLSKIDLSTSQGANQAADVYQKMGKTGEALTMVQRASQLEEKEKTVALNKAVAEAFKSGDPKAMEQTAAVMLKEGKPVLADRLMARASAVQTKNNARLDVANQETQDRLAATKEKQQKVQVMSLARLKGKPEIAQGVSSGNMSAEAAFQMLLKEQDKKLYELSPGESLVDAEGNRIAFNPKPTNDGGFYEPSVYDGKAFDKMTANAYEQTAFASKAQGLVEQIRGAEWNAGAYATAEDYILGLLGKRDDPQYLRTRAAGIRNHEAIGMLPPGPASDRDVEIVFKGVPPANAGKEEYIQFLEASARVAQQLAEYDKMKAQHVIEGRRGEFQQAWEDRMNMEAKKQKQAATPTSAVEALQADPTLRDQFFNKYGWVPDGY